MKLNNRFIFGILSLLLAAVIAFVALPTIARQTNGKEEIVRITQPVLKGEQISSENAEVVEVSDQIIADIEERSGIIHEAKLYRNTYEDSHIACDWGVPYSVDNTNRYSYAFPDNINLGVHQNGEMKDFTALTPDDLPLGNVFGFSESLLDKMDIVEGETNLEILKEKLRNENGVILVAIYSDRGEITGGSDNSMYAGLSVGDTIQFYENGVPTEKCPIIAKTAITDTEVSVNVAGASMIADIGMPLIYMPEEHFKEIYKDPTLYALLFDVEEEYRQDMENYLSQKDDVGYISTGSLRATISSIKNVVLLVGGMIGAIFALVGVINFINLVMTNIIARRHEFATMQSIGMTDQQLRKMVILESLSYVLRAGIVGVAASGFLGLTLVKVLVDAQYNMMTFQMTLLPALVMLVLFLVVGSGQLLVSGKPLFQRDCLPGIQHLQGKQLHIGVPFQFLRQIIVLRIEHIKSIRKILLYRLVHP